jgi:riboflavin synthase
VFTGLIETVGTVRALQRRGAGGRLEVTVTWPDDDTPRAGDSIAVDGACLTAVDPTTDGFAADVSPETLERTLLGSVRPGQAVNLERSVRVGDRLGGHLVLGHVDGVVRVVAVQPEAGFSRWRFHLPSALRPEVARKGSVAVSGVSLTVADVGDDWFDVALIPDTLERTTLGGLAAGARVHLETDVLAKYVARRLEGSSHSPLEELFGGGTS